MTWRLSGVMSCCTGGLALSRATVETSHDLGQHAFFHRKKEGTHGEKIITRVKSKVGGGKWAITSCDEKPDPDAIFLVDDDLDRDDD